MAVLTPTYPATLDTLTTLGRVVNFATTTVGAGGVDASATTVPITSTTGWPSDGVCVIGTEAIAYTGTTGTSITGCTRGFDSTAAASHAAGDPAYGGAIISAHYEALRDAIIAIETLLGANARLVLPYQNVPITLTENAANPTTDTAGYAAIYQVGSPSPNATHGGIWPEEARMGFTVARKFSSGGGADGPTAALTAHLEANVATSSGVALMTTGQVTAANGVAFGANLIALGDNVAGAKLVGCEIDVMPFAGTTPSSASGGLFLNAFNVDMTNAPALFVNGFTTGRWGYGLLINGITQNGVGVTIQSGAPEMEWGIHLNNGTFGTAAAQFGAQNDKPALILNQGASATTANILEVKDAAGSHNFFTVAGGTSGNWGSKSKASTDHVVTLDATTAGQNVALILRDAGTDKWSLLKNGGNDFQVYNGALGAGAFTISPTSAATFAGNIMVSKSDADLALVSTNAGNSQLRIYDTTDGGMSIFNQDGAFNICKVNASGSWVANRISVDTNGAVSIPGSLAVTGVVTAPDAAYGSGWNASTEVPTKNAVYDQIQKVAYEEIWDFTTTADGSNLGTSITDLFGTNTAITTLASTKYEFEILLWYARTTAGTATFTFTNTQTYDYLNAQLWHSPAAGSGTMATSLNVAAIEGITTAAAALPATTSQTLNTGQHALIKGTFATVNAGTWRIRVTNSAGSFIVQKGSKFMVRRLPSGNIGTFVA